jgi:putative DNA primase/helicase
VIAATITDDAERDSLLKFATSSEKGKGIQFGLGHAQTFPGLAVTTNAFDTRPEMLNFLNGTLNLDTLEFSEARKADMISRQMATRYDATAKAPVWEEAVRQIFNGDTELLEYVQRAMGYCLSGKTNEQAFFIGHGSGANGKSTILNTVRKLMGDYGSTTAFATFDADNRNQYGNDLAALKGRRFVIAIEAEQSKRLAEARVKTVTGGEPVSCRFLYGEFFEMVPEFKVWLAVNHKPIIRGADHGIWRRIHLIPFEVTFGSEEDVAQGRAAFPMDRTLDDKLNDEWPGIVNWLVQGYREWKEKGLNPPASVQAATQEYKRENDNVALWLDERCEVNPATSLPATEGYLDFREYLTKSGEVDRAIPSMRVWGTLMAEKGFQKKRTSRGYDYIGLSIQPLKLNENRGN